RTVSTACGLTHSNALSDLTAGPWPTARINDNTRRETYEGDIKGRQYLAPGPFKALRQATEPADDSKPFPPYK
ncbi:MAG: hypothetical protein P8Z77_16925, partial [Candidatus Thiodiazotropha sp.]